MKNKKHLIFAQTFTQFEWSLNYQPLECSQHRLTRPVLISKPGFPLQEHQAESSHYQYLVDKTYLILVDVNPLDVWTVSGSGLFLLSSCLVQINNGCYGNGMMFVDANCAVSLKHSAVAHSIYFSFCSHEKAASREENCT